MAEDRRDLFVIGTRLFWNRHLCYHLRGQAGYPFRPLEAVRRDQSRRVRAMVTHAYRRVPHYREVMERQGLSPADFVTAEDLGRLPILERRQVQSDPERFAPGGRIDGRYLCLRSGGSTGAPIAVYHDARSVFQNAAHGERERSIVIPLIGKGWGYREALIASPISSAHKVQAYMRERGWFPRGARIERLYLSLLDPPEVNVPRLNAFRPDVIRSYGSYLQILFVYLYRSGAEFHRPALVTYGGDSLSPRARGLIEGHFAIPVFTTYQSVEMLKVGFDCGLHRGLHLNIDLYPVRIVDDEGREALPGEEREVIVSNLVNRAMVLLNYRQGDRAALLPGRCPCGRTLPLLERFEGRCSELIRLSDGREVSALLLVVTSQADLAATLRNQLVQVAPGHIRWLIVPFSGVDRGGLRSRLEVQARRVLGQDARVDVEYVDHIPTNLQGKLQHVGWRTDSLTGVQNACG